MLQHRTYHETLKVGHERGDFLRVEGAVAGQAFQHVNAAERFQVGFLVRPGGFEPLAFRVGELRQGGVD